MDVNRNRKFSENKFHTNKVCFDSKVLYQQISLAPTRTNRQAGYAVVITGDVAVASWYLAIFLRCGALLVMEFE